LGTDDSLFVKIFTTRSWWHLAAVDRFYRQLYGHSLRKAIKKETSGDYKLALLALSTF
jgi:annexin A7/11